MNQLATIGAGTTGYGIARIQNLYERGVERFKSNKNGGVSITGHNVNVGSKVDDRQLIYALKAGDVRHERETAAAQERTKMYCATTIVTAGIAGIAYILGMWSPHECETQVADPQSQHKTQVADLHSQHETQIADPYSQHETQVADPHSKRESQAAH